MSRSTPYLLPFSSSAVRPPFHLRPACDQEVVLHNGGPEILHAHEETGNIAHLCMRVSDLLLSPMSWEALVLDPILKGQHVKITTLASFLSLRWFYMDVLGFFFFFFSEGNIPVPLLTGPYWQRCINALSAKSTIVDKIAMWSHPSTDGPVLLSWSSICPTLSSVVPS